MRVRKPKYDSEGKGKTIVTHVPKDDERPRRPSEELQPLLQYRPGLDSYVRDRWIRNASVYLRAFLSEGLSREEIKKRLGIDDKIYDEVEMFLLETEASKFTNMGTAHRYYVHMLRVEQCIRELDQFTRTHMEDDPKRSGVVGAIKTKASLYESLMKMGQDLGIIQKRAKEIRVLGEINLVALPNEELRQLYQERMSWFQSVMQGTPNLPPAYANILKNAIEGRNEKTRASEDEAIDVEWEEKRDSV